MAAPTRPRADAARTVLATALVCAWTCHAERLDEATVIRLTRERHPEALVQLQSPGLAEAELTAARVYPNPSLTWDREGAPQRQDDVFLSLPLDFSGRRFAAAASARSRLASSRAHSAQVLSTIASETLSLFYSTLAAQEEVQLTQGMVQRLEEAGRVLESRHQAGTTSGFERLRFEVEVELARSRQREAQAQAQAKRVWLAGLLGLNASALELEGTLAPSAATADSSASLPPSIGLLRTASEEAGRSRSRAGWAWIPEVSVYGGVRIYDAPPQSYGYVMGMSLPLPLLSNGQDVRAEAAAHARLAEAEASGAERLAALAQRTAKLNLHSTLEDLRTFQTETRDRLERLERAAVSSYREGQHSIVDLVDAQKTAAEVRRRQLELQLAVKHAEVALRAAHGEFE